MNIKINNSFIMETGHSMEQIAKLIEKNTVEWNDNMIIFWKNVWSVTKEKEDLK